jgi:hypothetical protein
MSKAEQDKYSADRKDSNWRGVSSTINPWFCNWFGFNKDCCNRSPKYKHSLIDSMYPFPVVGSVQHVQAFPMGMFANFPSSGEYGSMLTVRK